MIASILTSAVFIASLSKARDEPVEMLIRMTVDAAPAPKPALRYLLLPELKEMTPGNPIPNYLKCMHDQDFSKDQETLNPSALRLADRAARMDKPDWQILPNLKAEGINLLLPDVQKMRQIAAELQTRFREEIAVQRFDDALVTAKTILAMSRHMAEHPTLIGELVGIAIAFVGLAPLEEMLQQPGCPNLYWALTNLPDPFITLRQGMEGERIMIQTELRDLDDRNPMTAEQLKKVVEHIDFIRRIEGGGGRYLAHLWILKRTADTKYVAAARDRLVEYGLSRERLGKFPSTQVVLLDEKREYEVRRDEAMKYLTLPTWEAMELLNKIAKPKEPPLLDILIPAIEKVRQAQGRLEQKIAFLRHVEALRMYAAGHRGEFPAKLADVEVPLPVDPFSGKPFRYEVKDGVAHLRGMPPKGYEKISVYNLHYEISIRK